MAKSGYVSYLAVVISVVLLLHIAVANQPVPCPCGAPAPDPQNTGNTGRASVKLATTFVETVVPTGDPFGASTYTTLRSGYDKHARKDTPGFVSALRKNVVSNFHSHLIALSSFSHLPLHPREWTLSISLIDRVTQIPNSLAYHATNAPSVVKRYYVSGYDSLVDSITAAKSAMVLALIDWNMYMDHIAASKGWGDSLPPPLHDRLNVEPVLETGLLPGRQTELALRKEESLSAYAGSTAQRTTLLLGWIVLREVRKWEVVGKTTVWVARVGRRAWDGLVTVAVVLMALLAVLVLLGLAWVLMWWWRAAMWLWQ